MPKRTKKRTKDASKLLSAFFGELNRQEKYFAYAFVLSIVMGFLYGLIDQSIAHSALAQSNIAADTPASIFWHNFVACMLALVTVGFGIFVVNFVTYAGVAGLIVLGARGNLVSVSPHVNHPAWMILPTFIGVLVVAFLELSANFCFGISGYAVLEKARKKRTNLNMVRLLLAGTVFLLIGATLESGLEALMH